MDRSPNPRQARLFDMGDLASVIPPNAHAVVVVRAADYNAGRRLVVKAHSAAEQESLLRGTLLRKRSARSRPVHTCEG